MVQIILVWGPRAGVMWSKSDKEWLKLMTLQKNASGNAS